MSLQDTHAAKYGGGFFTQRGVRLRHASLYIFNSTASCGGGFDCASLELVASVLSARRASAETFGGAFHVASMYARRTYAYFTDSQVYMDECVAGVHAGGFFVRPTGDVSITGSEVRVSNTKAGREAGGFRVGSLQVSSSVLRLEGMRAGMAGGFVAFRPIVIGNRSNVTLVRTMLMILRSVVQSSDLPCSCKGTQVRATGKLSATVLHVEACGRTAAAEAVGGFSAETNLEVVDGSTVSVDQAEAPGGGAGFRALGDVRIAGASTLRISRSTAQAGNGGGGLAKDVLVTEQSQLLVSDASSGGHGGGLELQGALQVMDRSTIRLERCWAQESGGGVRAKRDILLAGGSQLWVSDAASEQGSGGGLRTPSSLTIAESSRMELQNVSAQWGGGLYVSETLLLDGASNLSILESTATVGDGGAFVVEELLQVSNSRLHVESARAHKTGGGFAARVVNVSTGSSLTILLGFAGKNSGGFFSKTLELSHSRLVASQCSSRDGGGFRTESASLTRAHLSILGGAERGGGFFVERSMEASDSELWVAGWPGQRGQRGSMTQQAADAALGSGAFLQGPLRLTRSALHLQNLQGRTALVSRCLELSQSLVVVNATTAVGISLQNAACSCGRALRVDGALVGSGISSALLSVDPCGDETLAVTDVWLQTSRAAVAETTAHTRVRNVTVEYLEPLDAAVLLNAPSFDVESAKVSCAACTDGVTFGVADGFGLQVVSASWLRCGSEAALNDSSTQRCGCVPPQVPDKSSFGDYVKPWETRDYCVYCPPNFESHDDDDDCHKCPLHKADLTMVSKHNRTQLCAFYLQRC